MEKPNLKSDPEAYLNMFNRRLFQFYKSILFIGDENIENKTRELLKKTLLSELLYKNQFISISGMQGVGKSTILAHIYGLPPNLIPQNLERGERLPILFTEKENGDQNFKTFSWQISGENGKHSIEKEEIQIDNFQQRCLGPIDNDIFLEVEVPRRVFETEGISFLLLPGLEDSNENWQNLVELSLKLSSNTVFVFNETKYADLQNKKTLVYVREEFKEAKPIFCLSFADQSKDENESLKKSVLEEYGIENREYDRVIITGTRKELISNWMNSFKAAINKYSRTEAGFRSKQLELLDSLMMKDVNDILRDFDSLLASKVVELKIQDNQYERLMDAFDDKVDILREKYLKVVSEFLNEFSDRPFKELDGKLAETSVWTRLKNMLFGKSHTEQREFEKLVKDSWDNANGFKIHEVFPNVLSRLVSKELFSMGYNDNLMKPPCNLEESLVKYDEEKVTDRLLPPNVIKNVEIINNEKYREDPLEPNPEAAIKLIPVLALEATRLLVTLGNAGNDSNKSEPDNFRNMITEVVDEFVFLKDTHSKVLLATAGIFGIDISDGTVDSIPLILNHLGVELGETTLAILNASIALGLAGLFSALLFRQVNKHSLEERQYLIRSIELLIDGYNQKYLETFEDIMDTMRRRLDSKLSLLYLNDNNHHHLENAKRFRNYVKEAQLKIREEISIQDLI